MQHDINRLSIIEVIRKKCRIHLEAQGAWKGFEKLSVGYK